MNATSLSTLAATMGGVLKIPMPTMMPMTMALASTTLNAGRGLRGELTVPTLKVSEQLVTHGGILSTLRYDP